LPAPIAPQSRRNSLKGLPEQQGRVYTPVVSENPFPVLLEREDSIGRALCNRRSEKKVRVLEAGLARLGSRVPAETAPDRFVHVVVDTIRIGQETVCPRRIPIVNVRVPRRLRIRTFPAQRQRIRLVPPVNRILANKAMRNVRIMPKTVLPRKTAPCIGYRRARWPMNDAPEPFRLSRVNPREEGVHRIRLKALERDPDLRGRVVRLQPFRHVFRVRQKHVRGVVSRVSSRYENGAELRTTLEEVLELVKRLGAVRRVVQIECRRDPHPIVNPIPLADLRHGNVHLVTRHTRMRAWVVLVRDVFNAVRPENDQFADVLLIRRHIPRVISIGRVAVPELVTPDPILRRGAHVKIVWKRHPALRPLHTSQKLPCSEKRPAGVGADDPNRGRCPFPMLNAQPKPLRLEFRKTLALPCWNFARPAGRCPGQRDCDRRTRIRPRCRLRPLQPCTLRNLLDQHGCGHLLRGRPLARPDNNCRCGYINAGRRLTRMGPATRNRHKTRKKQDPRQPDAVMAAHSLSPSLHFVRFSKTAYQRTRAKTRSAKL